MIKAVIFDLDDTLYNERSFVEGGFKAAARCLSGRIGVDQNRIHEMFLETLENEGRGRIFDTVLKRLGMYEQRLVQELVGIYRNHVPDISPYPDTISVLQRLKGKYKIGLITDGNVEVQRKKVEMLRIGGFFDVIVFSDEYGEDMRKPSSFPYLKAIKELAVTPAETIYVGDNPNKDFVSSKKLGIHTVRILRGLYKDLKLDEEFEAEYQIKNLEQLFDIDPMKR